MNTENCMEKYFLNNTLSTFLHFLMGNIFGSSTMCLKEISLLLLKSITIFIVFIMFSPTYANYEVLVNAFNSSIIDFSEA